jgi:hypothetical protein
MTTVWIDTWRAIAYASKELAVEAGSLDPIECQVVDKLPLPWSWIKRSVTLTDGVAGQEWVKRQSFTYTTDHEMWIGAHIGGESNHWVTVEMWAPDNEANNRSFDELLGRALREWQTMHTYYFRLALTCPAANHVSTVTSQWEER